MTHKIETALGTATVMLKANGRGFRTILLDGTKIGWMHSTYDGWAVMIDEQTAADCRWLPRETFIAPGLAAAAKAIANYVRHHRDQAETERKNRDRQTLTIKRKIVETLATAEDFRAAGMLEEARLADQLADSLEARL